MSFSAGESRGGSQSQKCVQGWKRVYRGKSREPVMSRETSKASTTLPGKVEKVIQPHPASGEPEKAQIAVEGADHLYREIRVPNSLTDSEGHQVKLKEGAQVEVTIEADRLVTNTDLQTPQRTNPPNP